MSNKVKLIGRENERESLRRCESSDRSELVIVYGRRRIGKTFLIEQHFNEKFAFWYVGVRGLKMRDQLRRFASALAKYSKIRDYKFKDWFEAFDALRDYLQTLSKDKKQIVFIDEMPWMDSSRSNFVVALEDFWNGWAMSRGNIMLVATGSATSWMRDKLVGNRGGLHGRITCHLHLAPFTLYETEQYVKSRGIRWDRYQILQSYMLLGGVPFYYSLLEPKFSLAQNVDRLFFDPAGQLRAEFDELYGATFPKAESYLEVVKALSNHPSGLTVSELSKEVKLEGSFLTRVIKNLERCDFIERWSQFGNKKRLEVLRLVDFFTLFYYKFIEPNNGKDKNWWVKNMNQPVVTSWMGNTFETVCIKHHEQIKDALGLKVISTSTSTWRHTPKDGTESSPMSKGAQIDMIIERADRIIHLCEIKFYKEPYPIKNEYEAKIRNRMAIFREQTKTTKALVNTFITTFGVANAMSHSIVDGELTMDDLFRS